MIMKLFKFIHVSSYFMKEIGYHDIEKNVDSFHDNDDWSPNRLKPYSPVYFSDISFAWFINCEQHSNSTDKSLLDNQQIAKHITNQM